MDSERTLRVDPIACDGHGLCAELFPERVSLDDWGYPIIDPAPVSRALERLGSRAIRQCPKRALDWSDRPPKPARQT
jgi:ferredoxin